MKKIILSILCLSAQLGFAQGVVGEFYRWSAQLIEPIGQMRDIVLEPGIKECKLDKDSFIDSYRCELSDAVVGFGSGENYQMIDLTELKVFVYPNEGHTHLTYRYIGRVESTGEAIPYGTKVSLDLKFFKKWVKKGKPFKTNGQLKILGHDISRSLKGYQYPPE